MVFYFPLNIDEWLIQKFAGTNEIFILIAFLVIAIMAARFKMPGGVFVIVFLSFILLMGGTILLGTWVQGLLILIIAGIIYGIATVIGRSMND